MFGTATHSQKVTLVVSFATGSASQTFYVIAKRPSLTGVARFVNHSNISISHIERFILFWWLWCLWVVLLCRVYEGFVSSIRI